MTGAPGPRSKPVDGHRLDRVRYGVEVLCECGWCSCVYYGKGSRREAYAEWRSHLRRCTTKLARAA